MMWVAVFTICSAMHCRTIEVPTNYSGLACNHALQMIGADLIRAKKIELDERITEMDCLMGESL